MWYSPEIRFRILIVRRPADGAVVGTSMLDAEKFPDAAALEDALGQETVRLHEQHGQGLEVFKPANQKRLCLHG